MKFIELKALVVAIIVLPMVLIMGLNTKTVSASPDDAAALYKKNTCFACHKADASKFFDPAKTDEELTEAIMKGKKGEKPPYMPGYEAKGMTAEQALLLAAHMRTLREASN